MIAEEERLIGGKNGRAMQVNLLQCFLHDLSDIDVYMRKLPTIDTMGDINEVEERFW
jgi:hypothetical protein